jgi:signal transduction histidine kinase
MSSKILIVEDSQLVSFHMKNVLEDEGYEVMETLKSGEEAIEFVKHYKPDLILMDIMLDGKIDGIETSIIINEMNDIPIIYLTALFDKETLERANPTFPYSYLNKPFSETELISNIKISLFKHKNDVLQRASREQFSSVIELMKNGLLIFSKDLSLSFINKSARQLFTINEEVFLGKKLYTDFKLYDYRTNSCLRESIDLDSVLLDKRNYQNDEFTRIEFEDRSIICTDLVISKLQMSFGDGEIMIMFNEASKELQKEQIAEEKERDKIKHLMEGQEQERLRVSSELHDGLGQLLNVIKMQARQHNAEAQFIDLIDKAIAESTRLSKSLAPSYLLDFPLPSCLQELVASYEGLPFNVRFNTNLPKSSQELDQHKLNIYRIVQEAINNSIKHAKAQNIEVQLYKNEEEFQLTIEDDGEGFDATSANKISHFTKRSGHGLNNIINRAKIINGELSIESSANLGTMITLKFQLNEEYPLTVSR